MQPDERSAALSGGIELFNAGRYLAAHELFEELWEATQGGDSDFFKGLVQAAVALHHFESGNLEGAQKLHSGLRRCLAGYLPAHAGLDVARFLTELQVFLPLRGPIGAEAAFRFEARPRLFPSGGGATP